MSDMTPHTFKAFPGKSELLLFFLHFKILSIAKLFLT
jgi:hypothetical protein